MARYIECETACAEVDKGDLLVGNNAEWAKEIIRRTPTADVVPKSEVEKLKAELIVWKQDRFNLYQRLEFYEFTRQKVAREIFEEIEKCLKHDYISSIGVYNGALELRIAELKKKYTEASDEKA